MNSCDIGMAGRKLLLLSRIAYTSVFPKSSKKIHGNIPPQAMSYPPPYGGAHSGYAGGPPPGAYNMGGFSGAGNMAGMGAMPPAFLGTPMQMPVGVQINQVREKPRIHGPEHAQGHWWGCSIPRNMRNSTLLPAVLFLRLVPICFQHVC